MNARSVMMVAAVVVSSPALAAGTGRGGRTGSLVSSLIDRGIAIGRERHPLKKAEHFQRIADDLVGHAESAAKENKHKRARRLAEQFGKVSERGVSANLGKAAGRDDAHSGGLENAIRVHEEKLSGHEAVLQRVLAKAPESARKGLMNAIEKSRRGRQRSLERLRENLARHAAKQAEKGAGKGKGKPEHAGKGRGKSQGEKPGQGNDKEKGEHPGGQGRGQGHGRDKGWGGKAEDEPGEEKGGPKGNQGRGRGGPKGGKGKGQR